MSEAKAMSCEEALAFLAAYLDDELPGEGAGEVEHHLARCRSCFSRAEFEKRVKQRLGSLGRSDIRPEFAERVRGLLDRFSSSTD
jgi:anti-sigma factor (TIGR02949 family)